MRILVTGGAGYIGSLLTGVLLSEGHHVTVVDDLLFGGESLLGHWHHPNFHFVKGDLGETGTWSKLPGRFDHVVHLAAIVGFPACQAVGHDVAWRFNVEVTQRAFAFASRIGAERFIFSSTYSNYGLAKDNTAVTEESPLYPQSLYAETKIAAEQFLLAQGTT